VTIDTLRADRVGCYGATKASTPNLDALASRGTRFETAIAHAPLTAPSHASILTGLLPLRHGVRDNGSFSLPPAVPTLAENFRARGYRTAAFVSGFPLDHRFGLARGFETYDDHLPHGNDRRRAPYVERGADATTTAALAWLQASTGSWFAWVHYFDPHSPYEPPEPFASRFADRPYDGEVAFVDQQLGRLLAAAEADASRPTLVLITADHGEGLGDHGEDTHGVFLYDSTLRVPLIVAGPRVANGLVLRVVAQGVDLAPTLRDLAALPAAPADGRSLRPALEGRVMSDAAAYSESLFAQLNLGWAPLHAWRTAQWKYVDAPEPELFDLASDAAEARNVAGVRRDMAEALRRPLAALIATKAPDAALQRTGDAAERLRALGYLGGAAPARPSGRDPKSGLALLMRLERGLAEARSNPDIAIAALGEVLREEPHMPLALRYRAVALQSAGRYDAAVADLRALEKEAPLPMEDLVLLAETLRLAGRAPEALEACDQAVRLAPSTPEPQLFRGRVLRALGRPSDAASAFESVLHLEPGQPEALRGLGELALERGDAGAAAATYEKLLARDATDAGAKVKLGVAYVRSGRVAEALALFEWVVAREPRNAEALLDLAGALAKSGRAREAIPHFERAIEAGGPTTVALNGLGLASLESGDTGGGQDALRRSLRLDPKQPKIAEILRDLAEEQALTPEPRR
jgi:arylsulfatase A-like enzyme/Tfp pilus assembly protein PilF